MIDDNPITIAAVVLLIFAAMTGAMWLTPLLQQGG